MQTTYRLKVSELSSDFLKSVKSLFKKDAEIEITVSNFDDFGLNKTETKEEYWARINKAIDNVEKGKNLIRFTGDEFEELTKKLLNK